MAPKNALGTRGSRSARQAGVWQYVKCHRSKLARVLTLGRLLGLDLLQPREHLGDHRVEVVLGPPAPVGARLRGRSNQTRSRGIVNNQVMQGKAYMSAEDNTANLISRSS